MMTIKTIANDNFCAILYGFSTPAEFCELNGGSIEYCGKQLKILGQEAVMGWMLTNDFSALSEERTVWSSNNRAE